LSTVRSGRYGVNDVREFDRNTIERCGDFGGDGGGLLTDTNTNASATAANEIDADADAVATPGINLLVGQRIKTTTAATTTTATNRSASADVAAVEVVSVMFDREIFSEKTAVQWWQKHEHRIRKPQR